jgi:hypothetical protein
VVLPPAIVPAVEDDDFGTPHFDPATVGAERVGVGSWQPDLPTAAGAGWIDLDSQGPQTLAQVEHSGKLFVLFTAPPGPTTERRLRDEMPRVSLWLARLEHRGDADAGAEEYRRVLAVRLYDQALPSDRLDSADYTCSAPSELRARDVDADREVELTAIASIFRPADADGVECGAVAFLVGADDLAVQARFTREYHYFQSSAAGDEGALHDTRWRFVDADHDGHADLHLIEAWSYQYDFEGDYVGETDDGESDTAPASRQRGRDRRELDCLYVVAEDVWRCPDPQPGSTLFRDANRPRDQRPW